MRPGTVSVGSLVTSTPPTITGPFIGDSVGENPGTELEPEIVAFLASNDDDHQVEARIVQKAEDVLRRQVMEEGEVVAAADVNDDASSTLCGWKKRSLVFFGILSVLLIIIGGVLGGVLPSRSEVPVVSTPAPMLGDALLEELRSLNATSDEDLWRFNEPDSPQSQALAWMKNDIIIMSSGRSTRDVLQRYVLAVLFYATNGPKWDWSQAYLSADDVCSWNNGTDDYGCGVYCRLDGESVDELMLSSNSLVGQLPSELGLLTSLEIIQLEENSLLRSIPTEFGKLLSLKYLAMYSNQLTGTIPTVLGQLLSLTFLDIGANQLTGTIPTELGQLLPLEYLDVSISRLTGTIPTELGQLLSLESLDIEDNRLTGTIPRELGQLLSLEYLDVSINELTGAIPTELGQLLSLEALAMLYNKLTGTIPTELGQLLSLESLDIQDNRSTGTIPTEFGKLLFLKYLSIHFNQLTGTVPTELGQLLSLVTLGVTSNQFTGAIPTELGHLLSLDLLELSSNRLTGTIPTELVEIGNLTTVYFTENLLTGSLEQSFCVKNRTWYSCQCLELVKNQDYRSDYHPVDLGAIVMVDGFSVIPLA